MLEDVPGLLSPIIQRMGQIRQQQQQQADLAERTRAAKANEGLEAQQHAQAQAIADRQADLEERRLTEEHNANLANLRSRSLQDVGTIRDLIGSGVDPKDVETLSGLSLRAPQLMQNLGSQPSTGSPALPAQSVPQPQAPSTTTPPAAGLSMTPASIAQAEANKVRMLSQAQEEGQQAALQPSQIQAHQWQMDIVKQQMDHEDKMQQAGFSNDTLKQDRQLTAEGHRNADEIAAGNYRAQLSSGTQMAISNAERHTQLMLAGIAPAGPNGEISPVVQAATTAIATGLKKPDFNNPIDRAASTAVINQGGQDVSGKAEEVKNLQQLNQIYDRMDQWNQKYGAKGAGGIVANAVKSGTGNLLSDAKPEYDSMMADFLKLAQGAEGANKGRVPIGQFNLEQGGAIKMTNNKAENDKIIAQGKQRVQQMVGATLQGIPSWQQDLMAKTYGIKVGTDTQSKPAADPDWLKVAPVKNKNGTPLNKDLSIKEGKPVYGGQ